MREISLDRLRTLVEISDLGSFAEAARRLNLAPPTISLHVAELEARVGAPLLTRNRGQVRPTAIGETLLARARRLLADADGPVYLANINGETVSMPGRNFRIKKIPDPIPSFGGKKPYDSTIAQGDASVAAGIRADMDALRFNTAIAKLIQLNNALTQEAAAVGGSPREVVVPLVQMLSPLCPHIAEELWSRLGNDLTVTFVPFPVADQSLLVEETIEYPVQINGKVRTRLTVPNEADQATIQALALADEKVIAALDGEVPKKIIVIPGRMVNLVV